MALRFRSSVTGRAANAGPLPAALAAALPVLLVVTVARAEYAENFDAVMAPALPPGWTTAQFGFTWTTTTDTPDTIPNCVAAMPLNRVSEAYLDSPVIDNGTTTHLVRFRHRIQLEAAEGDPPEPPTGFDGGVLEIAIGTADYRDIIAAGGEFLAGGYTATISNATMSLIGGRQAWTGDSGGYISTSIRLPPSALNSTFRLRFRLSCDNSNGGGFWAIDTLDVVDECVAGDVEAPVVVCAAPFSIPGRGYVCDDPRVTIGSMATSITDNCPNPLTVTQDPPVGTAVPVGANVITVTVTDLAGNSSSCSTTLTVFDPVAGQCGICCGPALYQVLVVGFGSLAGHKLTRRRFLRKRTAGAPITRC